jgi:hypothetical protein
MVLKLHHTVIIYHSIIQIWKISLDGTVKNTHAKQTKQQQKSNKSKKSSTTTTITTTKQQ